MKKQVQVDVGLKAEGVLPRQRLKAERVQDELAAEVPLSGDGFVLALDPGKVQERLKAERVQEDLKAMAGWRLAAAGKSIYSAKTFPSAEVARHYGTFVNAYAGALGLPVLMSTSGGNLVVTLYAPRSRGRAGLLTAGVLDLARRIG